MAQKSENSRKIAAKISEGMQGNGIFRNSYKIDAVRVRVAQNVLWTQSLHILEKTRLYSAESGKNLKIPQSIDHNLTFIITALDSQECLFICVLFVTGDSL